MLQTLEQRDLADGRRWDSVVFLLKPDFFERHCLSCKFVDGFVYHSVSSLSQLIKFRIAVNLRCRLDELLLLFSIRRLLLRGGGSTHVHLHGLRLLLREGLGLSLVVIWVLVFHVSSVVT